MTLTEDSSRGFVSETEITMSQREMFKAAARDDWDAVENELKNGADISACDFKGNTILHVACFYGSTDIVRSLLFGPEKCYNLPVDFINKVDQKTPLHVAGSRGNVATVHLLLSRRTNVNAKDPACDLCYITS